MMNGERLARLQLLHERLEELRGKGHEGGVDALVQEVLEEALVLRGEVEGEIRQLEEGIDKLTFDMAGELPPEKAKEGLFEHCAKAEAARRGLSESSMRYEHLAEALGLSPSALSLLKTGKRKIPPQVYVKLNKYYSVPWPLLGHFLSIDHPPGELLSVDIDFTDSEALKKNVSHDDLARMFAKLYEDTQKTE